MPQQTGSSANFADYAAARGVGKSLTWWEVKFGSSSLVVVGANRARLEKFRLEAGQ